MVDKAVKFMGLDLSLTSTGYSCDGDMDVIAVKKKGVERLGAIRDEVMLVCREHRPDVVLIEGYSFASRASQAHSIGELGGVIRLALYEDNYIFVEIPPTCRAKFATGRGNAAKTEVISAISARTGLVWEGKGADDMCDAWILEQMGRTHFGLSDQEWPKKNLEALESIDWSHVVRKHNEL
jgi:Holliday junction resolvasome RuvABC endonuclease subunit